MLCADSIVGATAPSLQIAEDEAEDRQHLFGYLSGSPRWAMA